MVAVLWLDTHLPARAGGAPPAHTPATPTAWLGAARCTTLRLPAPGTMRPAPAPSARRPRRASPTFRLVSAVTAPSSMCPVHLSAYMYMSDTTICTSVTKLGKLKWYTEKTARLKSVMLVDTSPYCRQATCARGTTRRGRQLGVGPRRPRPAWARALQHAAGRRRLAAGRCALITRPAASEASHSLLQQQEARTSLVRSVGSAWSGTSSSSLVLSLTASAAESLGERCFQSTVGDWLPDRASCV